LLKSLSSLYQSDFFLRELVEPVGELIHVGVLSANVHEKGDRRD